MQGKNQVADMIPLVGMNQLDKPAGSRSGDMQEEDNHTVARKLAAGHIQQEVEWADQCETSAGLEAQPSLAVVQTCHLSYPSRPYVVSACTRRPCSTRSQTYRIISGKLLGSPHFRQSSQRWKRYKQLVADKT